MRGVAMAALRVAARTLGPGRRLRRRLRGASLAARSVARAGARSRRPCGGPFPVARTAVPDAAGGPLT